MSSTVLSILYFKLYQLLIKITPINFETSRIINLHLTVMLDLLDRKQQLLG